jgi:hypothetical protein
VRGGCIVGVYERVGADGILAGLCGREDVSGNTGKAGDDVGGGIVLP